jgi:hypothetical protein
MLPAIEREAVPGEPPTPPDYPPNRTYRDLLALFLADQVC